MTALEFEYLASRMKTPVYLNSDGCCAIIYRNFGHNAKICFQERMRPFWSTWFDTLYWYPRVYSKNRGSIWDKLWFIVRRKKMERFIRKARIRKWYRYWESSTNERRS